MIADDIQFPESYLKPEKQCLESLILQAKLSQDDRSVIAENAAEIIQTCRHNAGQGSVFDAILQEYGLSSDEGVTLMRLVEALIRTVDEDTAYLLIRDKLSDRNWLSHKGQSSAFIVNRATDGLRFSAGWIKATGVGAASTLLSKLGDKVLYQAIKVAMQVMSRHFVLGETIKDAVSEAKEFAKQGYSFSYDMLGEAAYTWTDAHRYRDAYTQALERIVIDANPNLPIEDQSGLSVKLSALHPRYEYAKKDDCVPYLIKTLKDLALIAKSGNVGLSIDAEEADRLELSMHIARGLLSAPDLAGWSGLCIVVQAYQRRAPKVIEFLLETAKKAGRKFSIRLVKGAYWDSEIKRAQEMGLESYPVFTRKENTDVSFLACARQLLDAGDIIYPRFATHNAASMAAILRMADDRTDFEFQRLHGMGGPLHDEIMRRTPIKSRIYAPVGRYKDLLPYLVRRLLENGANSSFVNQFLNPDVLPEDLAADPIAQALENKTTAHDKIPPPRDIFDGRRLLARGLDHTQADSVEIFNDMLADFTPNKASSIIKGKAVHRKIMTGKSGFYDIVNPANKTDVIGQALDGTISDLEKAIKSAKASNWGLKYSAQDRADCLRRAARALNENRHEFLALCVKEAGKSWIDAIAELREAIDFCEYYANRAEDPDQQNRFPLGTVACISPWNFPLAIFLGQVTASLAAGNCVICKPAEQTPLIAFKAVELLHRAGIPKDALHLVIGPGTTIGAALVSSSDIDGICFTGSTATAKRIAQSLADTDRATIPFIAETGGINAMIIDSTALLEQAVSDVIMSSFQSAGQRCSACRIVCVQDDIADDFNKMLSGAMALLEVGNPSRLSVDVGPVINQDAQNNLASYIDEVRERWALIGSTLIPESLTGYFVPPTAVEVGAVTDLSDEQFGPILHVYRFGSEDFDDVLAQINSLGFGLTLGLHTRIDRRAEHVANFAKVGNIYVNRNQIGAVVGVQPFGGERLSGTGPKAGGPYYVKRLSKRSDSTLDVRYQQDLDTFNRVEIMLGPTGETNELSLHPRGTLLCEADENLDVLKTQIFKVTAASNSAHIIAGDKIQNEIKTFQSEHTNIPMKLDFILPEDLSKALTSEIDGVVTDGPNRNMIAKIIAERDGPILPVLSVYDDIDRFGVERTVTIDVSAAGGNATLLAL